MQIIGGKKRNKSFCMLNPEILREGMRYGNDWVNVCMLYGMWLLLVGTLVGTEGKCALGYRGQGFAVVSVLRGDVRAPCDSSSCITAQYCRGETDAQSLSGYISIELPLDIDMSFEAIQPPCINVSGVRSALNTGLCLSRPKKATPPAWQFFFSRSCILFLLSPLVVRLVPPIISWNVQIELFA